MKQFHPKVGDLVTTQNRAGFWVVHHIRDDGTPMLKKVCSFDGKKSTPSKKLEAGKNIQPAQDLINKLQFISDKYNGINRQHD